MKKIFLMSLIAILSCSFNTVIAQNQSTKIGQSTIYKVNESQDATYHTGSTYTWVVTNGSEGTNYEVVSGTGTNLWEVRWLQASPAEFYTVRVAESRGTCSTLREFKVKVTADGFDVMVAYATGQADDVCATASGSVIGDEGTPLDLTDDTDFGSTNIEVTVSLTDIAWKPAWDLGFDVKSITSATINSVTLKSATGTSNFMYATGSGSVEIAAATTEVTFVINVQTTPGVAHDIDLEVTSAIEKTTGNNYADSVAGNNSLTEDITIKAMPATTGITFE